MPLVDLRTNAQSRKVCEEDRRLTVEDPRAVPFAFQDLRFRKAAVQRGREYGLAYAEKFHYIGPDTTLDDYLRKHTVALSGEVYAREIRITTFEFEKLVDYGTDRLRNVTWD